MKILNQDLWSAKADLVVVTCNGYVTKDGRLVMGRGVALEAAKKYPTLQIKAGARLIRLYEQELLPKIFGCYVYGFTLVHSLGRSSNFVIGLFQVKYNFKDKAKLSLIGYSVTKLNTWLCQMDEVEYPVKSVAMNFPGIGYGGLPREEVEPILRDLDNRVTLYVKE